MTGLKVGSFSVAKQHWEEVYSENPFMYSKEPSFAGKRAVEALSRSGAFGVLDLAAAKIRHIWLVRAFQRWQRATRRRHLTSYEQKSVDLVTWNSS
jgi:hypothetical protein